MQEHKGEGMNKACKCIACGRLTKDIVKIQFTKTISMGYVECEIDNQCYMLCHQCYAEHKEESINGRPVTDADLTELLKKAAAAEL